MGVPDTAVAATAARERRRSAGHEETVRFVGAAAASVSNGVPGVHAVTTDLGHRRRGIGAAVTAAALRVGRERGLRAATLQTSPDGGRDGSRRGPADPCGAVRAPVESAPVRAAEWADRAGTGPHDILTGYGPMCMLTDPSPAGTGAGRPRLSSF